MISLPNKQLLKQRDQMHDGSPYSIYPLNQMHDGRFRYEIYLEEDIHWTLVSLAAGNRMHQEDYAEQILTEYATIAMNRANESLEETNDDN